MTQEMEQEDKRPEQQEQGPAGQPGESTADATRSEALPAKPLTTQGTQEEIEENLGGTTNLSLDQLKKEGDAGH